MNYSNWQQHFKNALTKKPANDTGPANSPRKDSKEDDDSWSDVLFQVALHTSRDEYQSLLRLKNRYFSELKGR